VLSLAFIREHADQVKKAIAERRDQAPIDEILRLDAERRDITVKADELKRERNETSKRIGRREVPDDEIDAVKAHVGRIGEQIKQYDARLAETEESLNAMLLQVPNIPDTSVPKGSTEADNVEVKVWGAKPSFDFEPQLHDEIGQRLGIFETRAAVNMSGTRFHTLSGKGAKLHRALGTFMLDMHINRHGFEEQYVPYLVKREAMIISAQLPKFEDDAYYLEKEDMFLIPTGEVPLVNLQAGQVLDAECLPLKYTSMTPCFRREAGAAGRDTRGMIRVHQYEKVEMVMFTEPEESMAALQQLLGYAESVLQALGLAYHVLEMNTSDLGFGQVKKYDPEVWMPGHDRYVEISSCSNMGDFQARRGNIKYSRPGEKPGLVHTLNGSGLAIGRTLAALLENGQRRDGSVALPPILGPYLGGDLELKPPA
jgi:seryl-tRNA synthetase